MVARQRAAKPQVVVARQRVELQFVVAQQRVAELQLTLLALLQPELQMLVSQRVVEQRSAPLRAQQQQKMKQHLA